MSLDRHIGVLMIIFWLYLLGPFAAALVLGIAIPFLVLRSLPALDRRITVTTLLAGAIPPLVIVTLRILSFWSPELVASYETQRVRAVLPLALGALAVVLLAVPAARSRTSASADLSRRSLGAFLSGWWIAVVAALAALAIGLSVALGVGSGRDFEGRDAALWIDLGTRGGQAGTGTYGWYFSVPALIALAVLLLFAGIAWWFVPRRAWSDDRDRDAAVRRLRCANLGRAAAGALLVHLGDILHWLWSTSTVRSQIYTTEAGTITVTSPFAALGPVFVWSEYLAAGGGLTLWILVALTAVPSRARQAASAPALVP
ncbi:hypothetical protein [Microbacterium capsulatum]|uniref:Uncharacterized protein n=1 Tax=Microbacterium capsulatum TaxID=3041921 RepID=A0ABU0XCP2_9MICO|nr:hypothetical protein [Microbacterium sp. ASV81]MDQ4212373.1 hypothetical protein [Microbacterium sp. ASV81]